MRLKKFISGLIAMSFIVPMFAGRVFANEGYVTIDESHFPDYKFRLFVSSYDCNDDGILTEEEARDIKTVDGRFDSIEGVEYLCWVENLTVGYGYPTEDPELDFSNLTQLKHLNIFYYDHPTIDISHNVNLETLCIESNGIEYIDLRSNTELTSFEWNDMKQNTIDISHNTKLEYLSLDYSYESEYQLDYINISHNPNLLTAYYYNSEKPYNDCILCNYFENEDDDTAKYSMFLDGHPDIILTGNEGIPTPFPTVTPLPTSVPSVTVTSTPTCTPTPCQEPVLNDNGDVIIDYDNFPDPIFRSYVADEFDSNSDGLLSTSELNVRDLSMEVLDMASLEGIEFFNRATNVSIKKLTDVTVLDLSSFNRMTFLSIESNHYDSQLSYLNLTNCSNLQSVTLTRNTILNEVDFSNCSNLKDLFIGRNNIDTLDLSDCVNLESIMILGGGIKHIDISHCSLLTDFEAWETDIEELDLSGCPNLESLTCSGAELSEIELSTCTNLTDLNLNSNSLNELNVSDLPRLQTLKFDNNNISSMDFSHCPRLRVVWGQNNNLTSVDLSMCNDLEEVSFDLNNISNIEFGYCRNLHRLTLWFNNLRQVDISDFPIICSVYQDEAYRINEFSKPHSMMDLGDCTGDYYAAFLDELNFRNHEYENIDGEIVAPATGCYIFAEKEWDQHGIVCDANVTIICNYDNTAGSSGILSFAERLYTCALGRNFDVSGRDYWAEVLTHGSSGADVAYGFFFSDEVMEADITNREFVIRLYKTFMDRNPSEDEIEYWTNLLSSGTSREDVFWGFVNSVEWANICLRYGIYSGGLAQPSITIEPSNMVIAFATRLYTTCLGREGEPAGIEYWSTELANRRISGSDAARAYFFSEEFINANVDDREFVNRLYLTFMDRDADDFEFDYWLDEMSNGMSREDVFSGFGSSYEFNRICSEYGIMN